MIANYLSLGFRLLLRSPFFTLINLTGLSVGFAVFFILQQYSSDQLNSDRQWNNWERVSRVGFFWEWTDDGRSWDNEIFGIIDTSTPLQLAADYPEIESVTRIISQPQFDDRYVGFGSRVTIALEGVIGQKRFF
jgi:putative ABC transport system permease protein